MFTQMLMDGGRGMLRWMLRMPWTAHGNTHNSQAIDIRALCKLFTNYSEPMNKT